MKKKLFVLFTVFLCLGLSACAKPTTEENKEPLETAPIEQEAAQEAAPIQEQAMQTIGTDEFGYVSVPKDWVKFQDLDGSSAFQYSNLTGSSIVSLSLINLDGLTEEEKLQITAEMAAQSIWYNLEQSAVTDIVGAKVTLADQEAFQVYGNFISQDHSLPSVIVCWILADENGTLHYISVEAPNEEIMQLVLDVENSYSFTNPQLQP